MSRRFPNPFRSTIGLWRQDIIGSIAHATMLEKIGILTQTRAR